MTVSVYCKNHSTFLSSILLWWKAKAMHSFRVVISNPIHDEVYSIQQSLLVTCDKSVVFSGFHHQIHIYMNEQLYSKPNVNSARPKKKKENKSTRVAECYRTVLNSSVYYMCLRWPCEIHWPCTLYNLRYTVCSASKNFSWRFCM
jgi:hypothetical protein